MKKNVGNADRIGRIILGVGLLSLYFVLEGNAKYAGLIGIVPIFTAIFRFCPGYTIFGISTHKNS
jgi:hypothetical protein